jgi:nucleoside-diphosphate-sugar epimerase
MPYHLLTGATGLLGTYLLRDGLCAGRQMAVLVRPSVVETPRQRIESILARWEREIGYVLPRPPVLEGNIGEPDLGLDRAALDWVAEHCVSVLHNAASLSFQADERTGEPFRSNVDGTRNVLELCRKTGIRQFHHVSSAYVCGLREGRVLESELDVGQKPGNAYEESKIQAEKMVRQADFLDAPTVYRPAIIIGDSATGYTTTFHGFYSPLKIGQGLVDRFHLEKIEGAPLLVAALGLTGNEGKSFVPVDWVSRVITYLHGRPEHHGRTYHVTLARRVPVAFVCDVVVRALSEYARKRRHQPSQVPGLAEIQGVFVDQMETYRSYWRDDPEFDRTNTVRAAPHLASAELGLDSLMRTARFALETNFGWPRPQPARPEFDVQEHLGVVLPLQSRGVGTGGVRVGLQVNGPGGGQWTLVMDDGRPRAAEPGLAEDRNGLLYLSSRTYQQVAQGQLTPEQAFRRGLLVSEANHLSGGRLLATLSAVTARDACGTLAEGPAGPNGTKPA